MPYAVGCDGLGTVPSVVAYLVGERAAAWYAQAPAAGSTPGKVTSLRLLDASTLQFHSTEVWDLAVLRLVGLAKSNEAPDMSGFYPMRTGATPRD
jgi:hypothetical protein